MLIILLYMLIILINLQKNGFEKNGSIQEVNLSFKKLTYSRLCNLGLFYRIRIPYFELTEKEFEKAVETYPELADKSIYYERMI